MELDELLKFMTKMGASDLHLKPMRPPLLRVKGKLVPVKADPLPPKAIEEMLRKILNPQQMEKLESHMSCDLGHGVPGVARFRANIFYQRGTLGAVFRRVPFKVATLDELNLPQILNKLVEYPEGLVLVTGPTGSGKSTTLAAMIQLINETQQVHIVTIEDPIEFLLQDKHAAITQREVGTDTITFAEALKNSLRQDPDVILVGEMRDSVTLETVLTAAETGHLVFSTLHTNNASQTIDRIIDMIPTERQAQVRSQLAMVLKAVVSLKLIEKSDSSGLTAAIEVMINSPKIAKHIEAGETKEIHEEMENSVSYYRMQSMNQSLLALLVNGEISYAAAMELSSDPEDLSLKMRKLFPKIEEEAGKAASGISAKEMAEIKELMNIRAAYDEQEKAWNQRIQMKDAQIAEARQQIAQLDTAIAENQGIQQERQKKIDAMRQAIDKLKLDANAKINALNEKIRDANAKIMQSGKAKPVQQSGFFKR